MAEYAGLSVLTEGYPLQKGELVQVQCVHTEVEHSHTTGWTIVKE
jgi:hypothetical protein